MRAKFGEFLSMFRGSNLGLKWWINKERRKKERNRTDTRGSSSLWGSGPNKCFDWKACLGSGQSERLCWLPGRLSQHKKRVSVEPDVEFHISFHSMQQD